MALMKFSESNYQPELVPISSVGILDNPTHIIIPTNEINESMEARIEAYCKQFQKFLQERPCSEEKTITDQKDWNTHLSGSDLLVYGTIHGKLWLKAQRAADIRGISVQETTIG